MRYESLPVAQIATLPSLSGKRTGMIWSISCKVKEKKVLSTALVRLFLTH